MRASILTAFLLVLLCGCGKQPQIENSYKILELLKDAKYDEAMLLVCKESGGSKSMDADFFRAHALLSQYGMPSAEVAEVKEFTNYGVSEVDVIYDLVGDKPDNKHLPKCNLKLIYTKDHCDNKLYFLSVDMELPKSELER